MAVSALRQPRPSSARRNSLQQRCLFCFEGNHGPFVCSPAFRRSGPAKAGTPCNFPRRPCFVMKSVRGLDIAKKPCSGSSSLRMESRLGVCNRDGFSGIASEERRCFGVRAAVRSVDAALAVPEEANPIRIPISSTASREEPRNPQRGHPRTLNEWKWSKPSQRAASGFHH